MTLTLGELYSGMHVRVKLWSGKTVDGIVTAVCEDIKNGLPGIEYLENGATDSFFSRHWAYLGQVSRL